MNQGLEPAFLRIGELSRRVGVSEFLLRAWELRYGLLDPARSSGGYRLYSLEDLHRVRQMQAYLAEGLAASQAAQKVISQAAANLPAVPGRGLDPLDARRLLHAAMYRFDEPEAQAIMDQLLVQLPVQRVLREVILPYLHDLGTRWEEGQVSIAEEHFASNVIRGRLTALAQGWGNGSGPQAVLACPPHELHDLALIATGIVLARHGWRIHFLGADTPTSEVIDLTFKKSPRVVLIAATISDRFEAIVPELSELASMATLLIAGAGASSAIAQKIGAQLIQTDPVTAAEHLAGVAL
jgi:DNA-binding transcriptional MerR regulator